MTERLKARIVTFLYHEVTDNHFTTGFQRKSALPYKHGISEFEENLSEIAKVSIRPCLVDKVEFNSARKYLLLTFDDGGKSAMNIADAIEKRGWKGHFFITTSMIGGNTIFQRRKYIIISHCGLCRRVVYLIRKSSEAIINNFYALIRQETLHEV